jgi:bifunctional UDP-N-acetylglucosamine pyrophosphorylase / glucosamine-1-phosphate N-acetyltransferase
MLAIYSKLHVVILSAGKGSRMNSERPKALQPLASKPLLGHVLEAATSLGPLSITVVYGHGGDEVRAAFKGQPIRWALQSEQKGTGHALAQAMPALPADGLVLVLYGDVPLVKPQTLRALVEAAAGDSLAILSVNVAHPAGYGRVIRESGRVVRIVEHKDASAEELALHEVNTGLLCAPAAALARWLRSLKNDNAQGEYYLTDVIASAREDRTAVAAVTSNDEGEVLGINTKAELARAEATYRARRAAELLEAGVTLIDPLRIDIRGVVETGRDVLIEPNVILEGHVTLGDGVHIGTGCVLKDVTLAAGCAVLPYSVLDGVIAAEHCRIGPFARLRPSTVLKARVHIGNFVEVKNSTLGAETKAGHLTYLGDATLGARVNIGAGVVTANYDGTRKWPTQIEDDVFVGSGTMLIAPVAVRTGATIGAGSVIRREAPAHSLTLSRAAQETRISRRKPAKSWYFPSKRYTLNDEPPS